MINLEEYNHNSDRSLNRCASEHSVHAVHVCAQRAPRYFEKDYTTNNRRIHMIA